MIQANVIHALYGLFQATFSKLILLTLHIPECRCSNLLSVCSRPVASLQSKHIAVNSEPWPLRPSVHFWLGLLAVCSNCIVFQEATWRKEAWGLTASFFVWCCMPAFPVYSAIIAHSPTAHTVLHHESTVGILVTILAIPDSEAF